MKLIKIVTPVVLLGLTQFTFADGNFKRFSVSAGWLHVMPQGKANPFNINTSVANGTQAKVGSISEEGFLQAIDPNATIQDGDNTVNLKETLGTLLEDSFINGLMTDGKGNIKPDIAGTSTLYGLENWSAGGTGLEAEDVDTLGLMVNYYINDNVSLQMIGGIPPKVDIQGKGMITAPLSGNAMPGGLAGLLFPDGLPLDYDVPITNLDAYGKAATARAWTPVFQAQYQFGKSGVNKFRPYVGAGIMYAYFNDIELNKGIESDLIAAGHMIQNIKDNLAGAALDGKESSGKMVVDVDADDAIAPIVTLGFTYDFTPNWFTAASVSYAKLNNKTKIDVINQTTGEQLIHATTKIDIDPIITYLGVGYRF
ncbi:OmpW family protein [Acinetobacter sp. YH01020]|uniref:OmpW/AlkL family protein n=1 Tax=Acinetobacter sp. YH01020 TaxID=2601034 RepID=UPI0015D38B70|nr:OmpW family protein [Acinetobacter sp. YH01020]